MSRLQRNPRRKLKPSSVEIYTNQIRKLDVDLGTVKKQCEDYRKYNKKLEIEKENLKKQLHKLQEWSDDIEMKEQYQNEIKNFNLVIEKNDDTIKNLEQKVKELQSVNGNQQDQIQDLHEELKGLKKQLTQTFNLISELNNVISNHHQEIQDIRSDHEASTKMLTEAVNNNFRLMIKEFKQEMKGLKSEIVEDVTEGIRSELEERPDPKFYNYNISHMPHQPSTSWE